MIERVAYLAPSTDRTDMLDGHDTITDRKRREDLRFFRQVMVVLAVAMVSVGLLIILFQHSLSLSADEARDIASVFLVVGAVDTLVLYYWPRLFPSVEEFRDAPGAPNWHG